MRDLAELAKWRIEEGDDGAAFRFQHKGQLMLVIASHGMGWDHVSVSFANRCPTWDEMEWVARKFFKDDECAMQLHVPKEDHVNYHPYALHWWRPQSAEIPRPHGILVGPKT